MAKKMKKMTIKKVIKVKKYKKRGPSKTKKGRLDYVTQKCSKKYNRRGHHKRSNRNKHKYSPFVKLVGGFNTWMPLPLVDPDDNPFFLKE